MSDTITGSTIADRYKVTGLLRSGRMGDIYVARRLEDGRRVSVKVLDPALFQNEEAVKRFERESRVTRSIDHPCSMRVLEFGKSDSGPYLVMEFVEGDMLSDLIDERGALAPERAGRITARIAMALQAAHDAGVIHRDLAPSNVLVTSQDTRTDMVKVTDFGLALLTHDGDDAESTNLTAVGVRIGTPTYMAPEYIEEYELDHRADIYGLGVMLFEMLTGSPPYSGRPYKVMDQHVNAPIPRPSAKVPSVPAWLDELVVGMMAKDPNTRIGSAAEVVSIIARNLGPIEVHEYVSPTARPAPPRQQRAPRQSAPETDPILEHLVATHTRAVERSPHPAPRADRLMVVTRVAPTSVAGALGIGSGWRLHLPDEDSGAGLLDPDLSHRVVDERRYHFFPPGGGDRVELRSSGIPIGVELIRSPENVVKSYDPLVPDPSALLDLWRHGRWSELEKLAWRTVVQSKGSAGLLATGLFARFLGSDKPKLLDHPAPVLLGAALCELGREAEGLPYLTEFRATYAQRWPSIYDAIAHLYLGREKARTGDAAGATELLVQAHHLGRLPQAAELYQRLTGEALISAPWLGRDFPDYSMDTVDQRGSARLSAACSDMDGSQLLAVCMMGGFRGNLDYDAFMHRYATFVAFFPEFLYQLHVVTTATEREADKPEHYRGEDFARAAGVPFLVLQDYRAFVQRAVKPSNIPMIYLLNRMGTVVHEGPLLSCDLWEALSRAGELRVRQLKGGA